MIEMIHYAKFGVVLMEWWKGRSTDNEGEPRVSVPGVLAQIRQLMALIEAGAA